MRCLTPFEHGLRDGRRLASYNLRVPMHTTEQVMDYWLGYQAGRLESLDAKQAISKTLDRAGVATCETRPELLPCKQRESRMPSGAADANDAGLLCVQGLKPMRRVIEAADARRARYLVEKAGGDRPHSWMAQLGAQDAIAEEVLEAAEAQE